MDEPIQEWFNRQRAETPNEMIYKAASGDQIIFARDNLCWLIGAGLEYDAMKALCRVISEHTSKSVKLPVYSYSRPDLGLRIVLRGNFYDWKLSVISQKPIEADFEGLFYTTPPVDKSTGDPLSPVYFEGFPRDLIFDYYQANRCHWSAEIRDKWSLWATLFLIMRSVGAVKPFVWPERYD